MGFWGFLRATAVRLGLALQPDSGCGLQPSPHGCLRLAQVLQCIGAASGRSLFTNTVRVSVIRQSPGILRSFTARCAPPHSPWSVGFDRLFRHSTPKECA